MVLRDIITIDRDKCDGCGLCVTACHEGALQIVDGKAELISESYCDGLGDCLPKCPTNAITIEKRKCEEFDEEAVKKNMEEAAKKAPLPCGCPGSNARRIERRQESAAPVSRPEPENVSELMQWPVQIKLVPVNAPYFDNANLLVAADCSAFAYADFHNNFMKNKITIIGCPKLDNTDYSEKLAAIISNNNIKSVTVIRMEVPCCAGIVEAVKRALMQSGKMIPWSQVTVGTDGTIVENY